MEATHTLEAQVVGEIDRREIEAKAAEVFSAEEVAPEEVAPEPEHTTRRRRAAKETDQITADEGGPE